MCFNNSFASIDRSKQLNDKNNTRFNIYTECSSSLDCYNKSIFMMWYPMSLNNFLEIFSGPSLRSEPRGSEI